jgi:hypothetical protein
MALATINSLATTKTLHSNLRELPTYCSTIKGGIELLHSYFDTNYMQIIACEASVNNLVNILFAAYMVVPCHNFRHYIEHKQDIYTYGKHTITHEEVFLPGNQQVQPAEAQGYMGGKIPRQRQDCGKIQAKVTSLRVSSSLPPTSRRPQESRMMTKEETRSRVEVTTRKRRTRKTMLTRESRRRMRTGRRPLPRREKLMKRKSRDPPSIGPSPIWCGAATRKETANLAKSASTSRTVGSTKLQPRPPWQPSSTLSGKPLWPTWPAICQ